ncbi:hypothetical protein RQP53_20905 [Paucibacter sp. APW11]|uniref:Uncharacterized protein n=1 Tax=Roseateles aquae TaxID=3077235 RepID=A0ABU3PGT3_9BURK|nr:hypothetical protein [Paucibacter sp. APW11]MDT9001750.1 hypothetical protein [Paucibacter sp. APW11]
MPDKIPPGVKWGAIGLLAATILLLPTMLIANKGDSALWFVALLVLMTAALTLTAIVFGGLNLNDPGEAFGLPSGSVRTLLAVGVMVLFAVFGLKFFADASAQGQQPMISDKPVAQIKVAADRLSDEVARYEKEQALKVIVTANGRLATATDAGVPAEASVYLIERRRSADAVDVQKQLLTAIITLLTTVIGFYFGSKSASEGLKRGGGVNPPADPTGLGPQRDALKTDGDAVDSSIATQRKKLADFRAAPAVADAVHAKAIAEALSKATSVEAGFDALRKAFGEAYAVAQDKFAAVATAAEGTDRSAREAEAQIAMKKARDALDALKQASQLLAEQLEMLRKQTAEG